jgi:DNA transposition AAA+ family ATPase
MSQNTSKTPGPDNSSIPSADDVEKAAIDQGATTEQVEEILWLVDFAQTQGINTFGRLAKEIGISDSSISLVLRGKYKASIAGFCETIRNFREVWTKRQELGPKIFVPELSVVRRITVFADLVRATQQIGIVWGDNQTGKSAAEKHYERTHSTTCYVKLPAGGAVIPSMEALARARGGIKIRVNHWHLRTQLLRRFNPQWLIIADEFHQTVKGRTLKTVTIDRFREFNDDCECGLLLCGTNQLPEALEDETHRHFLGQIGNRGVLRLQIPTAPEPKDIELLVKAYGFEGMPSGKVARSVTAIANERGIGALSKFFIVARRNAKKSHERLAWKHFAITDASIDSWAKGEFGNGNQPKQLPAGDEPAPLKGGK